MNKARCGRKKIQLTPEEKDYINEKVRDGWTPDVIIDRNEKPIPCSMRTLYRQFASGEFNQNDLPMQGKRKPNGHQEKRGLNEHSNGMLRKTGLPKDMNFNPVPQNYISNVAYIRNNIPRKSLNYRMPIECFMDYVGQPFDESMLSRLI